MTLLVSWIGIDSRGPASLYIMSESRISWKDAGKLEYWDYGKKVFAFKNSPDIIGYCGDVLFPTQVLSHVIEIADSGILFHGVTLPDKRFERIKYKIKELFEPYPEKYLDDSFSILYGTRVNQKEFACFELSWSKKEKWNDRKISHSEYSDKLFILGSGSAEFNNKYKLYQKSEIGRTSRAIFQCFSDTLLNIKDKRCGGAPQLIGLYRIRNAINFGIFYKKNRYLSGIPVENLGNFEQIEWRNELFELFNGKKKKKLPYAKSQPRPNFENHKNI
jgi:hypothetical protein